MKLPWNRPNAKISEEVASAISRILKEDKQRRAWEAGVDVSKFKYDGMTADEISKKLRERGII